MANKITCCERVQTSQFCLRLDKERRTTARALSRTHTHTQITANQQLLAGPSPKADGASGSEIQFRALERATKKWIRAELNCLSQTGVDWTGVDWSGVEWSGANKREDGNALGAGGTRGRAHNCVSANRVSTCFGSVSRLARPGPHFSPPVEVVLSARRRGGSLQWARRARAGLDGGAEAKGALASPDKLAHLWPLLVSAERSASPVRPALPFSRLSCSASSSSVVPLRKRRPLDGAESARLDHVGRRSPPKAGRAARRKIVPIFYVARELCDIFGRPAS